MHGPSRHVAPSRSHGSHGYLRTDHYSHSHDADWDDEGSVCFEPVPQSSVSSWKWVGDGRGAYEKVQNFTYVGQGAGSFERARTMNHGAETGSMTLLCFRACWCGVVAGFLFFLILFLGRHHFFALPVYRGVQADWSPVSQCLQDVSLMHQWTPQKRAFCCAHTGRYGCPVAALTTTEPKPSCEGNVDFWSKRKMDWCCRYEGPIEAWSLSKMLWCCRNYEVGCPHYDVVSTPPFDCSAGVHFWHNEWSGAKKAFCCTQFHVGCVETTPAPPKAVEYDCLSGYSHWRTGWSAKKKTFCCKQFQRGCSSDPYECDVGFSNWKVNWSAGKKDWCCQHQKRGCAAVPVKPALYDCSAGLGHWETLWSPKKKDWCCKHLGGCHVSTTVAPSRFDCTHGYQNWSETWTSNKKAWCCDKYHVACNPTAKYDCGAGFENWRADWSEDKTTWCCEHEKKGCSTSPFDCEAGYAKWKTSWSPTKKDWCCSHEHRACPPTTATPKTTPPVPASTTPTVGSGYDCNAAFQVLWSDEKKEFCCKTVKVGCSAPERYDCHSGLSKWKSGWSSSKKDWCCAHYGTGCENHRRL